MPSGKQEDAVALKIQETAQDLFDKFGVEEVSMHRIAQEAGIGQGTLYRRYPSKGKLCFSLMEAKFQKLTAEIEQFLAGSGQLSVKERLSWVMTKLILRLDDDLESLKALFSSPRLEEAKDCLFEVEPMMFVTGRVKALLGEAADRNELVRLDPEFASILIASSLKPEVMFYLHDLGYDSDQIAEKYCQCTIDPLFLEK